MQRATRVFVIDDQAIARSGLRTFLEATTEIEVTGDAQDVAHARSDLQALGRTDVILGDLVNSGLGDIEPSRGAPRLGDGPRIVILTARRDLAAARTALDAGIGGLVLKSSPPDRIIQAIGAAMANEVYIDPAIAGRLLAAEAARAAAPSLTFREREVLELVASGKSNLDIAARLFISERTARTHVSHLLMRLGLKSRVQLALWALENGMVDPARAAS